MYKLILTLHVFFAIFLVGPIVTAINQGARALLGGDAGGLKVLARTTTIYGWAGLLVLPFGAALVRPKYGNEWSDGWLIASLVLWVIGTGLVIRVVGPMLRRSVVMAEAGEQTRGLAPRVAMFSGIASLCYVVVAILMVWKPGT